MARKDLQIDDYGNAIAPDGDYSFYNPKNGATGKYKFSWNFHKDDIKKITGIKDREEFLKNKEAQDKYFAYHVSHNLAPAIKRLEQYNGAKLDDLQIAKAIHEKGEGGARRWLKEYQVPPPQTAAAQVTASTPQQAPSNQPQIGPPPTTAERDRWEKMKSDLYSQYVGWGPSQSHNDMPSDDVLRQYGIDPARVPAFVADFERRKQIQDAGGPHTVKEGTPGYSSNNPEYGVDARENRYTHYIFKAPGQEPVNLGTDADALVRAENQYKQQVIARDFQGFDDPTQNVNYVPPAQQEPGVYGFAGQGHAEPATPAPRPDPNFPTRDPITGIVTPAVNQHIINTADNDEEDDEETKPTSHRRILNGIFGLLE